MAALNQILPYTSYIMAPMSEAEVSSALFEREGFADSGRSSAILYLSNGLFVPE